MKTEYFHQHRQRWSVRCLPTGAGEGVALSVGILGWRILGRTVSVPATDPCEPMGSGVVEGDLGVGGCGSGEEWLRDTAQVLVEKRGHVAAGDLAGAVAR